MEPTIHSTLERLRAGIASAKGQQDADTDHPAFCVVSNRTVSEIIDAFEVLDAILTDALDD